MTMIMLSALAFVTLVAIGLGLMAFSDLPATDRAGTGAPDFDPYEAEARAYLLDREAA